MSQLPDKERFALVCQRKKQCVDWLTSTEAIVLALALMSDDVGDREALAGVAKAANELSKALWKAWDVYTAQMETPKNMWLRTPKEDV